MPVIINEFELAPAGGQDEAAGPGGGPGGPGAGEAGPAAAAQPPKAPVQDAERILRRQTDRMLRLYAH